MANIRPALKTDIIEMASLGRMMYLESPRYRNLSYSEAQVEFMVASLLEKDTNCVLVADLDNTVVGFMLGFVVRHFFSPDPADLFASDVALYVHPTHRGGSIGLRLIKAFEKWAIARGAKSLIPGITTEITTERTQRFYEALGYEVYGVSMIKRVKPTIQVPRVH